MAEGPKLVSLPERNEGNGAREAIDRYFNTGLYQRYLVARHVDDPLLSRADHMLACLWEQGLKVVPLSDAEPPHIAAPSNTQITDLWLEILEVPKAGRDQGYEISADMMRFGRACMAWGMTGKKP